MMTGCGSSMSMDVPDDGAVQVQSNAHLLLG